MAVSNITNQQLGKFLQIVFSDGIRNQISEDYRDWEMVKRVRVGDANGREHRFFLQSALGAAAIQYASVGSPGAYPAPQQVSVQENAAVFKEITATIELEYNLWNRAKKSPAKYAEPLKIEIDSKATAAKRRLSADLYGSGTGVLGTLDGAATETASSEELVLPVSSVEGDEGHIGWFEYGDKIIITAADGTQITGGCSAASAYGIITDKDRDASTVTVKMYDSSDNALSVTTAATAGPDDSLVYRAGQPTRADLSSSPAGDYNQLTEVFAGLESLTAEDGRNVHGITMSGATKGTRFDGGNAAIDTTMIQKLMSKVKVITGEGKYRYPQMVMAPEANDQLIFGRETDRRFQTIEDNKRGLKKFAYVHGNDTLEVVTSEFVPKNRIYCMPEGKGDKPLEFHGSDLESVRAGGSGSEFLLRPNGSGHDRFIRTYLEGVCTLVCKHPASIAVLKNFTV